MEDGERSARQYDAMAAEYAADNAVSPYNAFYERPATMALLGKVAGLRVLEVGCGSGILTTWLVDQGAERNGHGREPRDARPGSALRRREGRPGRG